MIFEIVKFLLDVAVGLLAGACLLRLYMQYQRIAFGNPVGRFVFSLTDWLVLPLRRLLPAVGRWDTASIVAAFLLELAQYGLLWLLAGRAVQVPVVLLLAVFGLLRLALSGLMGLVIVYAILSWVRADTPITDLIERLCAPLMRPWRRIIPLVGGIDLSPLAFLVVAQILLIVLTSIEQAALQGALR
ncbi:MAG TPA: YggT family protein [Ramlibacter sp.]|uniref:YggT family protein n=1 Tax=Ramlibacter sp. TaxID=1917967 RepID=UPI002C034B2E|nr:YggT family protein [Ramlibacter sp.]HVZ45359.1 YggT family protein [Ramlibacter sp.]